MVGSQWKQQYNVGVRAGTSNAQKIPEDYADLLHTFRKSVITVRKAENIGPADIVNMDQTMCRFDMPPSHTNNKRGERTIRLKTTCAEKKGFTVALAATASENKLPAVIMFKEHGGYAGGACSAESSHSTQCTSESHYKWLDDGIRASILANTHLWERISTSFVDY